MQPQQQQKPGLLGSTLFKLEQSARSAAPGLAHQVDKLLGAVGVNTSNTHAPLAAYQQPHVLPPYPAATTQYQYQSWPCAQPGAGYPQQHWPQQGPPQPYQPQYPQAPPPVMQIYAPAPVTQVYPAPAGYQTGPQYNQQQQPWQQQQQQAWPQQVPSQYNPNSPQQQQYPQQQQQQQQQQQAYGIPILEATVDIKPSGLPVGTRPVDTPGPIDPRSAPAAATLQQQQQGVPLQQQQVPLQQLLQQLWASAVPAAAQGAAAAGIVGRWYHQDAGALSEVTFMTDGRCYWSKSNTNDGAAEDLPAPAAAPAAGSGGRASSDGSRQSEQQQQQQGQVIWHGVWRLQGGNASSGQLSLVYIVEQPGQGSSRAQQQLLQQQRVVTYQRSALDDTLVLDGLAHVKLGSA